MNSKVSALVIDNFYDDPDYVREYALKQDWYQPYGKETPWYSTEKTYKPDFIIDKFFGTINTNIDKSHWNTDTEYNGRFHVKLENTGMGYHDHVVDNNFNSVGKDGWGCIVFLNPLASIEQGVFTAKPNIVPPESKPKLRHKDSIFLDDYPHVCKGRHCDINHKYYEHDIFVGNVYNRAVAFRGDAWHTGAYGFGNLIENSRMIQTFFFRTL